MSVSLRAQSTAIDLDSAVVDKVSTLVVDADASAFVVLFLTNKRSSRRWQCRREYSRCDCCWSRCRLRCAAFACSSLSTSRCTGRTDCYKHMALEHGDDASCVCKNMQHGHQCTNSARVAGDLTKQFESRAAKCIGQCQSNSDNIKIITFAPHSKRRHSDVDKRTAEIIV